MNLWGLAVSMDRLFHPQNPAHPKYRKLAAYAATLKGGPRTAASYYPEVARHIKGCRQCYTTVYNLVGMGLARVFPIHFW